MQDKPILVYGADWCGDCIRARKFLVEHQVPFEWIDIESNQIAENFVIETNQGMRRIPTILFQDGSILVEPSNATLAYKLGIA
jgi:glutaredoxin